MPMRGEGVTIRVGGELQHQEEILDAAVADAGPNAVGDPQGMPEVPRGEIIFLAGKADAALQGPPQVDGGRSIAVDRSGSEVRGVEDRYAGTTVDGGQELGSVEHGTPVEVRGGELVGGDVNRDVAAAIGAGGVSVEGNRSWRPLPSCW